MTWKIEKSASNVSAYDENEEAILVLFNEQDTFGGKI